MTKSKSTKRALLMSGLALFACISMLVGSTFAWFTDSVTSGRNVIAAGNLDVELYAGGVKVDATTELFDDIELWEPGAVVYENLQIANEGTLALKYQLSVNAVKENDLNGHKLSEVVKVAIIDKVEAGTSRADILAAAKASAKKGELSNLYLTGDLEAGTVSAEQAVVIYWEPTDHDNDYNANNGQKTSDGEPLYIEFGVQLEATQKMHEKDSFGDDYDKFASILPKAKVTTLADKKVTATTDFPNGTNVKSYDMDVAMQFEPNETYADAQSSAYRYWHADFVVKANRDVKADTMALAGYYAAFCDGYNNGNWVLLTADTDIPAGTEIRLVEGMGGGAITVNYEEICQYGNDGKGFQCGAIDLTGENVGTTITVELRMYETTKAPDATSGTANEEVLDENGKPVYKVIGSISHTFGAYEVKTAEELKTAVAGGVTEIKLGADIDMGSDKLTVASDIVLDLNGYVLSGTCNAGQAHLIMVNNGAALDIKDSSSAKSGKIAYAKGSSATGWAIDLEGELNLHSGTIELIGDSWDIAYCVDVRPNAWGTNYAEDTVFTMNGGKLVSSFDGIRVASSSSDTYGNIVASFVMNGGTIDAARDGIFMQQSNAAYDTLKVEINNGIVKGTRPIRVYGPDAASVNASTAKPMTIIAKSDSLVLVGALDSGYTWHTEGKIAYKGGMTLDNLNQYATITLN